MIIPFLTQSQRKVPQERPLFQPGAVALGSAGKIKGHIPDDAVPALLGTVEAEAAAFLQALGLLAEIQRGYNEKVNAGLVCGMEPGPNYTLPRGSKVVVTVSQGSAYVTCTTCGGRGTVTTAVTCPECDGTGTCFT